VARVIVPEKLAPAGLHVLREAGHEVEEHLDLSPEELAAVMPGAHALIVRSATQVDAALLEASPDLLVVGRAGVGLDNVDVETATTRGVMVCNAPQSNVVSAAEQAVALMLSLARNIPQAHSALSQGRWERSAWTGVEMFEKTAGIVGLGRVGRLVAERLAGFGMRLTAYDPFVSEESGRELGVEMMDLDELLAGADFVSVHLPKTPETIGLFDSKRLAGMKPTARIVNTARGGIIDETALAEALDLGHLAGAAIDVFDVEPTTESPLFGRPDVVVTPHLGASTGEAQDRAGVTIAEQVELALAGEFVSFAVNIGPAGASEAMAPYLPIGERLGAFLGCLIDGVPDDVEVRVSGDLADFDRRVLVLAVLRGLLDRMVDGAVTFVNVVSLAEERGMLVRDVGLRDAGEFRSLIEVRGGGHSVAGTLTRSGREPRIVVIDDHAVEVPLAHHLLVIRNDDRPGMIGAVGDVLGEAEVNISFMGLGRDQVGDHALMALATDEPVATRVIDELAACEGIRSVSVIELS
jgi:D-3-phosphoglycerate dehydrogenase / 2-oxoglutarate reductase